MSIESDYSLVNEATIHAERAEENDRLRAEERRRARLAVCDPARAFDHAQRRELLAMLGLDGAEIHVNFGNSGWKSNSHQHGSTQHHDSTETSREDGTP